MNERYSQAETRKIAERILAEIAPNQKNATVIGLSGDLGAGKTTLTQAIAEVLGVTTTVQSPTFVIAKFYPTAHDGFRELIHIDAYRIESVDELVPIGWDELLARPQTLIVVEWPERIASALLDNTQHFSIGHDGDYRIITSSNTHA